MQYGAVGGGPQQAHTEAFLPPGHSVLQLKKMDRENVGLIFEGESYLMNRRVDREVTRAECLSLCM